MADIADLLSTGPSSQRIDIVFVAEGYTASERSKFFTDAAKFLNEFIGQSNSALNQPYYDYRNYFNASALFVASNQSGVSTQTQTYDTYFGAKQYLSDGRLVYGDTNKVNNVVDAAYDAKAHELTIVLVNSSQYGGSGGEVPWATTGSLASSELLLHETGHGFANLLDEYFDPALVSNTSSSTNLVSSHVSQSQTVVSWSKWLGYVDSLGTVGSFEGALYQSTGYWRSTLDSKMNTLGSPFSAPQKEAIVLACYQKIGDYLSVDSSIPGLICSVVPDPKILSYVWTIDANPVRGIGAQYLDLYGANLASNPHTVVVTTTDNSGYVRNSLDSTKQVEAIKVASINPIQISASDYTVTQSNVLLQFSNGNNTIRCANQPLYDFIDGGSGTDTLVIDGNSSDYTLTPLSTGTVVVATNNSPILAVKSIEQIQFKDKLITALDTVAPKTIATSPGNGTFAVSLSNDITLTFDEPIKFGNGSISLKTQAGTTVETMTVGSSTNVIISGNTLTINPSKDLSIFTEYQAFISPGSISDMAGNSYSGNTQYYFKTATLDSLYNFFVVAFNAAPGTEYMNQLATAYNYGMSVKDIVNVFSTKPQFTDVYPVSLTNEQLATKLVANIVKTSATEHAKSDAVKDILAAMAAGYSRGDVLYQVFGNLAKMPITDPVWGQTTQQFINENAVAKYYTEVMGSNSTDLATLRAVIGSVDNHTDVSSPSVIATLIGVELAGMHV